MGTSISSRADGEKGVQQLNIKMRVSTGQAVLCPYMEIESNLGKISYKYFLVKGSFMPYFP